MECWASPNPRLVGRLPSTSPLLAVQSKPSAIRQPGSIQGRPVPVLRLAHRAAPRRLGGSELTPRLSASLRFTPRLPINTGIAAGCFKDIGLRPSVHAHAVARLVRPASAAPARPAGSGKRRCAEACARRTLNYLYK